MIDPPGQARFDWELVCEIATRMGYPMSYESAEQIFAEFTSLAPSYSGLDYENLKPVGKLWPCPDPATSDGVQLLFGDGFPTESGRGKFVPVDYQPAAELPDEEYPFILNTGRLLEHWQTGTMTRRSKALDAIEPEATCQMNPADLTELGVDPDGLVTLRTRRGSITLKARGTPGVARGNVFVPFHFREASANILTNDVLDPFGKIPEFKFCAVKVEKAEPHA